jgi:pyruvate,water dikinase
MMKYLIPFDDDRALRPEFVGEKFASLSRAHRSGFSVPPAAALSTEAHRYFVLHQRWPQGLDAEVTRFAEALDLARGVSIRSSAVREDLESQSFAGQYRSFLQVVSEDDLRVKIVQCWQSADAKSVRSYDRASAQEPAGEQQALMGVILQRMVRAASAGVAFGRHPVNPVRGEVVIEAVHGLAEPLVSGRLSPYRAFVDSSGATRVERPDSGAGADGDPLDSDQWLQIAVLLRKLEDKFGQGHLDIEWAFDESGKLWLLQCRRITTSSEEASEIPAGTWTRKIANDLWADRLTPFLGRAMIDNQDRFSLTRTCRILGIPIIRPTLSVIDGYLYINGESIRQVVALVPRRFRTSDLKALFPDGADFDRIPDSPLASRVRIALRAAVLFIVEPQVNPLICLASQPFQHKKIRRLLDKVSKMPDQTPAQALHRTLAALETMTVIQEKNQWPYSHATFFTWLLRWLSVDLAGFSHSQFLGLLTERGRNITLSIERQFRRLADTIQQDRELTKRVLTEPAGKLLADLPTAIEQMFNRFLTRYGCRSRHRTLYVKRWAEAPEEVIAVLQALVRARNERKADGRHRYPASLRQGQTFSVSNHDQAGVGRSEEDILRGGMGASCARRVIPVAVRLTSRFLDLREELRFLLDEVLYEIRRSLLTLGQLTGLGERVMFLHAKELQALASGDLPVEKAEAVSAGRYRQYHQPVEVHSFYVDGRPVEQFPANTRVLRGIGTSAGRVTGRARIVRDPTGTDLSEGEILVAENTDPGWTPILSMVSGMVVEEGGLLNHCSIVARELKVPAIVGIRQATRRIRDGALISIDGGLGIVRLEEE